MGWWPFGRKGGETEELTVEHLQAQAAAQAPAGPFRMVVEDVFAITGRGTVVTGLVETGRLSVGSAVRVVKPDGSSAATTVTAIEKFRAVLETAEAGETVGLLLDRLGRGDVDHGDVVEG